MFTFYCHHFCPSCCNTKKLKFFSKVKTINETHCHHCKRYLKFKVIFSIHCWIICTMTHHSLGMKFDRVNLIFGQDWFLQRVKMDPFLICTYLVGLKSFSVTIQNGGGVYRRIILVWPRPLYSKLVHPSPHPTSTHLQ